MDLYTKKPTQRQCTDEGMANELSLLCPGDVTTTICLLSAIHLVLETVLLLLQFIKEFCAAASFRKSSISPSTRSMGRPL